MKIAITGASGFIGKQMVAQALHENLCVVAITRQSEEMYRNSIQQIHPTLALDGLQVYRPDLLDTKQLKIALSKCQVVIHLAAVMQGNNQYQQSLGMTQSILATVTESAIQHLILVSSLSVLDYTQTPPLAKIDESIKYCDHDNRLGEYARMKRDQEKTCIQWQQDNSKSLTILRPGLVYSDNNLPEAHAGFIKKGYGITAQHHGEVPLIHVKQVVQALLSLCKTKTNQSCAIYHITESPAITQNQYLSQLRHHGLLRFSLPLTWQHFSKLMGIARWLFSISKRNTPLPDSFCENSVAARQKPFKFDSSKIQGLMKNRASKALSDP